jgi:hypothetical protein
VQHPQGTRSRPEGVTGPTIGAPANITMLIGAPIEVERVAEPTDAQVDAVHQRLLSEMEALFDRHKAALGWADKKIVFE